MKICPLCEKEYGDDAQNCQEDDADLMPLKADPLIGCVIEDRYRITNVIGVGSMGVVYRAVQEAVSREVAIKVLPKEMASNRQAVKRFHHEAKAASRLNHPHIITVYDFGIAEGGQPFIAMELLDGTTMDKYLLERKRLELFEALPIIQQLCDGIGEAHAQGLIHRDVKPANIALVERGGRKNHVIILDFGIAKGTERVNDPDATAPGVVFGSPVYMSPERFLGQSGDVRSDVYSLAVVIFQMLSGAVPFKSTDLINLISSHVIAAPPTVSSVTPEAAVPAAMEQALQRALAKSPDDRPQSMREFWEEIHVACKPRSAPNAVSDSIPRPLDTTGNESTFDVFKRLEAVLSNSGSMEAVSNAAAEAAAQQAAQDTARPAQPAAAAQQPAAPTAGAWTGNAAAAAATTVPAEAAAVERPAAPATTSDAPPNAASTPPDSSAASRSATAGAAPLRPYRNADSTPSAQPKIIQAPESTGQPQGANAAAQSAGMPPAGATAPGAPANPDASKRREPSRSNNRLPRQDRVEQETTPSGRFPPTSFSSDKKNDSASSSGTIITLCLVGCLIAGGIMIGMSMLQPAASQKYAQTLLSQGKLDDAGHVLALLRNDNKNNDAEAMDNLSMGLAREYVRINRLPAAIQTLQQIPPTSSQYETAQSLIKKYRDKLGI